MKPQNAVERALRFIPAAFIVFFLLSTLRGYVQPQWVIVAVFGLLYTLFTYARRHPRTRRYLMRMGWVTLALIALTRLVMIFNPLGIRYEVFDNRTSYGEIAEIADGRPVVFRHGYAVAAKYAFYTGGEAYCHTFSAAGETLYAYLAGEIDHDAAQSLRMQLDDALVSRSPRTLIIDLGGVGFMDSSGIGLILGRQRCARVLGTSLRLQHAPAQLQKVLRLAGIPCTENIEKENAQ